MGHFDELTQRLTHRLRMDPELRQDIAAELSSHLEDAEAELLQSGCDEQEARDQAVKALGDEENLTGLLWQANRGRIRFRQVARWFGRVALIPGAILLTFLALWSVAGPIVFLESPWQGKLLRRIGATWPRLTAEDRLIVFGGPNASYTDMPPELDGARAIAERWPDDPVCWGSYVTTFMALGKQTKEGWVQANDQYEEKLLALLDHGRRIEPDNAFYDLMHATVLFDRSCRLSEDPNLSYETYDRNGRSKKIQCNRVEISDPKMFAQAVSTLRLAAGKSHCTLHALDMAQRRLKCLGQPKSFGQLEELLQLQWSTRLPSYNAVGDMQKGMSAYAIRLAKEGHRQEAVSLIRDIEATALRMAVDEGALISLLLGRSAQTVALGHAIYVYEKLGMPDEANGARKRLRQEELFFNSIISSKRLTYNQAKHMGILHHHTMPGLPGYTIDPEPLRTAEYVLAERTGAAVLCLWLTGALAVALLLVGWSLLRYRKTAESGRLLFVGWRAIAKILLISFAAPVAAYAVYAHVLSNSGRQWGILTNWDRLITELVIVSSVMVYLFSTLTGLALRQRIADAGMDVPPKLTKWRRIMSLCGRTFVFDVAVAGIIASGLAISVIRPADFLAIWASSSIFVVAVLASAFHMGFFGVPGLDMGRGKESRRQWAVYQRTFVRSTVPVLAVAVVVFSLSASVVLRAMEAHALARATGPVLNFGSEVDASDFHLLRQRYREQHKLLSDQRNARRAEDVSGRRLGEPLPRAEAYPHEQEH